MHQYAVVYSGLDGQQIVYEVAYTDSQRRDALARARAIHADARVIRADLIGVE